MTSKKYRPGIDDPPPSRGTRLLGFLGLVATAAFVVSVFRRFTRSAG